MPPKRFLVLILAVIFAAAVTIWLLSLGGPVIMLAALPAFGIAAVAVRVWGK